MTLELSSRRRFLLFGILPISLMLIAVPVAPQIASQVQDNLRASGGRQVAMSSPSAPALESSAYNPETPRISPSILPNLRKGRRMVALDVISRLQEEASRRGGNTQVSPLDLKRLRNALRDLEPASYSPEPTQSSGTVTPLQ